MKLTETEKIILENTKEKYKYIARDECGDLFLYESKPKKESLYWIGDFFNDDAKVDMFDHLFQDIKWEDEEPYKFR